jgi:DNA repair exonuclease SbcCD ATPase subunit
MKILEFEYKNILSYGNRLQSFKFSDKPSLILVEGENGAGKSSIKEALTVSLYGKSAIRKIKDIPNWINLNAYTQVKFLTSSGDQVSVSRGIDPNFSNIEINGAPFNLPDKRKVDEFIEEELTKLPFSVFCNTVSLSFDDFKSFINLSKDDKRKIVDRLFGIDNLTQMRALAKDDLKELNREIDIISRQIQKNHLLLENSNAQLNELNKKLEENIQEQLNSLVSSKLEKNTCLADAKTEAFTANEHLTSVKSSISSIKDDINQKKYSITELSKRLELYQKNRCPHCLNDLTSESSQQTKDSIIAKIAKYNQEIAPLELEIKDFTQKISLLEEAQNEKKSEYYRIKAELDQIELQIKELKNKQPSDQSQSIQNIIDSINSEIYKDQKDLSDKTEKHQVYDLVNNLLSDQGIKKELIDKIIPTLNSRIKEISEKLHFKFNFEFNSDFDPIIQYLGIEVSPKSLSSGQQKKMNLIVLLAFIEIIKMKYSQLNVMFLDEIFSSLDKNNVYLAIQILREYANMYNMTIFVVSHESLPEEFFDTRIFVKSVNHFSEMEIHHVGS